MMNPEKPALNATKLREDNIEYLNMESVFNRKADDANCIFLKNGKKNWKENNLASKSVRSLVVLCSRFSLRKERETQLMEKSMIIKCIYELSV